MTTTNPLTDRLQRVIFSQITDPETNLLDIGKYDHETIQEMISYCVKETLTAVEKIVDREIRSTENGEVLSYLERIQERLTSLTSPKSDV